VQQHATLFLPRLNIDFVFSGDKYTGYGLARSLTNEKSLSGRRTDLSALILTRDRGTGDFGGNSSQ